MPRFRNWAGNQRCEPTRKHRPKSEAELAEVVRAAAEAGEPVRAVGAAHSWSDIVVTHGHLVSLDDMAEVIEVDPDRLQVRVQAGIRLKHLVERLAEAGLALPNLGSVMEQSIAGVCATGTHGSGRNHSNLSGMITAGRLVTANGSVMEVSEADPELLRAARVSLGCLGIFSELTLQCVPAFDLEEQTWVLSLEEAAEQLVELSETHEYVKLWWFPHTGSVLIVAHRRTNEARRPQSGWSRWYEHNIERHLFALVLGTGRLIPALIPSLNRLVARSLFEERIRRDRSDRSLTLTMPPRHREMEYAIGIDEVPEVLRELASWLETDGLHINFIMELRFVAADESLLSPAFGRDACQIGAYMGPCRDLERYFQGFESRMQNRGGRPHWGKEFDASPDYLRQVYPGFDRFLLRRSELDPRGLFANEFVQRHLGVEGITSPDPR